MRNNCWKKINRCDVRGLRLSGKPWMDGVKKSLDARGMFMEQGIMLILLKLNGEQL